VAEVGGLIRIVYPNRMVNSIHVHEFCIAYILLAAQK